jgi:hypothetical protein
LVPKRSSFYSRGAAGGKGRALQHHHMDGAQRGGLSNMLPGCVRLSIKRLGGQA